MTKKKNTDADRIMADCAAFSGAVKNALAWVNDEKNAERLQPDKPAIEKELRRAAFQSRKLEQTVANPMCVGVFGASQAGKSYLVSVLAAKSGQLTALFDGGKQEVDFLRDINPTGGEESTGLVTRFTVHPIETPPGFPVSVRLLNQTDIAKILSNTYCFEAELEFEKPVTREDLDAHVSNLEKTAATDYTDVLREEDLWDLQDYFEKYLRRFENVRALDPFWERIARLAPRLSIARRAELFSIFWGRHQPITDLYLKLAQALASLNFADQAFCQLDALRPSDTSIINVKSLQKLARPEDERTRMLAKGGATADIPKAVATALIAELQIVMKERPWDFLEFTDLLDFPGYRSRKPIRLEKLLAEQPEDTLFNMFLRGKVDFLFQRYTADQELTSMLLCVEDSTAEVVSLPAVIDDWIGVTHGPTPEERVDRATLLFLCLTKFDRQLIDKAGDAGNDTARFESRMNASLLNQFGGTPGTWPMSWTPDRPFDNCFWIRNPKIDGAAKIIESKDFREIAIRPEAAPRLVQLKDAYLGVEKVRRHFRDPERAWNEVLKLNDGGVSYLAENLGKVCLPDMKSTQVRARLGSLRKKAADRLSRYYVTTDLDKRLREREAVCETILEEIDECLSRERFGSLLAGLCIDRVHLGDALYAARTTGLDPDAPDPANGGGGRPRRAGVISATLGKQKEKAQVQPVNRPSGNVRLGHVAVQTWVSHMQKMAENEAFARAMGVSTATLREIVAEISGAARRKKLADEIASHLDRVLHIEGTDAVIAKATLVAARLVNGFAASLGYDKVAAKQRPRVPTGDANERAVFVREDIVHDASSIGDDRTPFAVNFALDWCTAFQATVRENASSEDGSMQDPEQNARLGKILDAIVK